MYVIFFVYLILLQESVSVTAFNKVNIWSLPDSVKFEIIGDSLVLEKVNYENFYIKLDSLKIYKNLGKNELIGINKSVKDKHKLVIENYLQGQKAYKFRLNELRDDKTLHDFMFYFAGIERAHYKEYFKSFYNFNKAYSLGVRTPTLKNELERISKIINKPFSYNKKKSSVNSIQVEWKTKTIENVSINYLSYINEFGYALIGGLLLFIVLRLKTKKKTSLVEELAKEEEPKVVQKTYPPKRKQTKKLEISEKKKRLLDVIEQSQSTFVEPIVDDIVSDIPFRKEEKDVYEKDPLFETEHINQNIGEVELALNLQSIKRKHESSSSKYDEIAELKKQNMSIEDIAKRLNITVTEVKLFFSFKDKN